VSKAKSADDKASSVKTELEAYMFYYHRYESHHNAMKIADEQRRSAERKSADILDLFQVCPASLCFMTFDTILHSVSSSSSLLSVLHSQCSF
jgi:hypothetical protein